MALSRVSPTTKMYLTGLIAVSLLATTSNAFTTAPLCSSPTATLLSSSAMLLSRDNTQQTTSHNQNDMSTRQSTTTTRRALFQNMVGASVLGYTTAFMPWTPPAMAADKAFAPGGTLVDYEVGVAVGNPDASLSRKADNSNVVFNQDYYYKFGTAAPWIEKDSVEFPKTMPFTPSQQRYDTNKKYRERVQRGLNLMAVDIGNAVKAGNYASIADSNAPEYSIRPLGLMANGFLASENTGTTNELLLARWYINEMSLDINDIQQAPTPKAASQSYKALCKAMNSYLGLMNRVMTSKVGDKFELVEPVP